LIFPDTGERKNEPHTCKLSRTIVRNERVKLKGYLISHINRTLVGLPKSEKNNATHS
jgi:hypothetical protein